MKFAPASSSINDEDYLRWKELGRTVHKTNLLKYGALTGPSSPEAIEDAKIRRLCETFPRPNIAGRPLIFSHHCYVENGENPFPNTVHQNVGVEPCPIIRGPSSSRGDRTLLEIWEDYAQRCGLFDYAYKHAPFSGIVPSRKLSDQNLLRFLVEYFSDELPANFPENVLRV